MRRLWFLVFFIESIEILLSVNIIAVRDVSCGMSIFPMASRALVIANCSAWLFEHRVSSLNFSYRASCIPMYSATPDPTPFLVLYVGLCMYVCLYIFVYLCMCVYVYMYYVCMYFCTYVCVFMYVGMFVYMCVFIYVCIRYAFV